MSTSTPRSGSRRTAALTRAGSAPNSIRDRFTRVAADVVERAAPGLVDVADVRRVVVEVREPAVDRLQPPDAARRHQLPDGDPRRVLAVHEGLHQEDARVPAGIDHALGLGRGHRERLLAQHVLAGPRGLDRPLARAGGWAAGCRRRRCRGRRGAPRRSRTRARSPAGAATALARPSSRDAMPRTSLRGERRRPGITFSVAMFAVDSTPQRTRRPSAVAVPSSTRPTGRSPRARRCVAPT